MKDRLSAEPLWHDESEKERRNSPGLSPGKKKSRINATLSRGCDPESRRRSAVKVRKVFSSRKNGKFFFAILLSSFFFRGIILTACLHLKPNFCSSRKRKRRRKTSYYCQALDQERKRKSLFDVIPVSWLLSPPFLHTIFMPTSSALKKRTLAPGLKRCAKALQ